MQTINLSLYKKTIIPVLWAKQQEVGRKFQVVFAENIPEGVTFSVWYSGASGAGNYTKIGDASAFHIDGNMVTVELIAQMLNNAGEGRLCLIMTGADGLQLGTWNIPYAVEAIPGMGSLPAGQYFTVFNQLAIEAGIAHSAIINEAVGDVIALNDSAQQKLRGLTLYGKTVQNGTPTPEAPIPMVCDGDSGSVAVKVMGKNLWSLQSAITGEEIASGYINLYSDLPKGVPITMSADITKYPDDTATNTRVTVEVKYTDGSRTKAESVFDYTGAERDGVARKKSATFTIDTNKTVGSVGCTILDYSDQNGRSAKAENIQIEIGSVATAYEPYKEPVVVTIPTPDGWGGLPITKYWYGYQSNYVDTTGKRWMVNTIDFTKGTYLKNVETRVFDGTEIWEKDSAANVFGFKALPAIKDVHNGYCSHFYYAGTVGTSNINHGDVTYRNGGIAYFKHTGINTLDEWKAWVAEQYANGTPLTIMYSLATPIEMGLSAEQLQAFAKLHTYKTGTRIENDCGADMKVKYVADTKTYIDKKFNELAAALVNNT